MPPRISASQIATVKDCPAKVCFDKVNKLPRGESPSAQLGTDIHAEIEDYFRDATPTSSAFAMALLQHLPPRTEDHLHPEHEFTFLWPGPDLQVHGFIDLLWLRRGTPEVHDHKSTSKLASAKTSEDLLTDPQSVFYAMEAVLAHHSLYGHPPEYVDVQLGYVDTVPKKSTPRTHPVRQRMTLPIIEAGLDSLRPQADLLKRIHHEKITGAQAAEQGLTDPNACFKYGPCHYRHQCPTYAAHHGPKRTTTMAPSLDLLAQLAALGGTSVADPTPQTIQPTQFAAPVPPTLQPFDTSSVKDVIVAIKPPDAAPDVSANDPPPPPLKPSRAKGAKALRGGAESAPVTVTVPLEAVDAPPGLLCCPQAGPSAEAVLENGIESLDALAKALIGCGLRDEAVATLVLASELEDSLVLEAA